jgi:hypothetical protein
LTAERAAAGFVALAEGMKEAQVLSKAPIKTHFDLCLEILNKMNSEEVINSKEYFRISRVLQKKDSYAAMFSGMSDSLRMEWLRDEDLIDRIDNEY